MKKIITLFIVFSGFQQVKAQSLPVGTPLVEDYYRRKQLNGDLDSSVSFTVRPLLSINKSGEENIFRTDSTAIKGGGVTTFAQGRGSLQILPLSSQLQYDLDHPYGWNDGAMIPARGSQIAISGGIYAQYGLLSFQLRPEYIWAENKDYEGFNREHEKIWSNYYSVYLNVSDIPERFGEKKYSRINWGQSSMRLTFDPVSIGLSNENLWWGPGKRSSILMSNNAPGFKHITINTTHPVKTSIGSIEGQMIAARLENSGFLPPEPNVVYGGQFLYIPKRDDWRYLSGMVISYQPKWVPGLFFGMSSVSQKYGTDMNGSDYLPLVQLLKRERDQQRMASVFARFLWPEAGSEIYFEYGRNANAGSFRDFLLDPEKSRAYIAGFTKLLPIKSEKDEFVQVAIEVTQLSQPSESTLISTGEWYTDIEVRQGYTNQGQVIGAGIGPGSNLQSLDLSWCKGLKKIGLQFERYEHNADFYNNAFADVSEIRKRWIDMSATAIFEWNYKNLLLNLRFSVIRSLNYQYWFIDHMIPNHYFGPGEDIINFRGQIGVTWRF
jgi:hypothetical protein